MSGELQRLRKIRTGQRAVSTRHQNEVKGLLTSDSHSKDELTRIKTLEGSLQSKLTILKDLDDKVLELIDEEEIENEIEQTSDIELSMKETLLKIQEFLESIIDDNRSTVSTLSERLTASHHANSQQQSIESTPSSSAFQETGSDRNVQNQRHSNAVKARLPKISLPRFNGESTKFFSFWESFESIVVENKDLTPVDKFNYLKASLEGTAAKALEGLPVRERTFDAAVNLLKSRFGNRQKIISVHMDQLLKIKACEGENIKQLRSVYDQINIHIRGLEALGVTADQYGSLLVPIVMSRLPNQISLQIVRHTSQDVWTLGELLDLLRKEVEARELNDEVCIKEKPRNQGQLSIRQQLPTASTLFLKEKENVRGSTPICAFCSKRHYSAECKAVSNINHRKEILMKSGRCFKCLRLGHVARNCELIPKCRKCQGSHNTALCQPQSEKKDNPADVKEESTASVTASAKNSQPKKSPMLLQTARTFAHGDDTENKVPVRILFDTGSHRTYISDRLRSALSLKSLAKETVNLNTFGTVKCNKRTCDLVSCFIETLDGRSVEISALTHPQICTAIRPIPNVSSFAHLANLRLADQPVTEASSNDQIDILVGVDFYYSFVSGEVVKGDRGPVAVKSNLGWLLSGQIDCHYICSESTISSLIIEHDCDSSSKEEELFHSFKQVFQTEEKESLKTDQESKDFLDSCNMQFNGKRYEVNLPWKLESKERLSNNKELSLSRLKGLQNHLKDNKQLYEEYDGIFKQQLKDGIIEKVLKCEENKGEVCMLPHHAVVREDKDTTKIRIVFDASARDSTTSMSLNQLLEVGPNYIPQLFDLLISFRSNSIALTADIERAFHQIAINEADRDFLRFYWFQDITSDNPVIVQYRFARLPFGLSCSPAILGGVLCKLFESYKGDYPDLIESLNRFYVDDLNSGCNTIEKGLEIYETAKKIASSGGFNLRKWHSNCKELMGMIEQREDKRANNASVSGNQERSNDSPCVLKILGVGWNTESDKIIFDLTEVKNYALALPITRRSLLKLTAKIFDPLGALNPFTIKLKCLFQETTVQRVPWDQELQGEFRARYLELVSQLNSLSSVSFPRYYFRQGKEVVNVQLHGFSDASELAYASVIFIRVEYQDGEIESRFISSKTHVAPLKQHSIPRLELMGATLLAKHMNSVVSVINIPFYKAKIEIHYWVDSLTTLCWIRNVKPWKQFVQNRVDNILKLTDRNQWKFCPGSLNPADIPSRGIRGSSLPGNQVWWHGPNFLSGPCSAWPNSITTEGQNNEDAAKEIVKSPLNVTFALTLGVCHEIKLADLIDINRFSSIDRVLRVFSWVRRFIENCKKGTNDHQSELEATEILESEKVLIRVLQTENFAREISYLSNINKNKDRKPPLLVSQFNLFIDKEGLLRTRTRINNASVSIESREPILLPSKSLFSELIIKKYHDLVFHNGTRDTLNAIRQKYWILRGRETVKKLVRRCVTCKKIEGVFFKTVPAHTLPEIRVDNGPPFINTGVDFAGPLYVTDPKTKETSKTYICLFTCMSTRAIHLELVKDLTVSSFLCAFRRFAGRRGLPNNIFSDNAKTFKSAAKEIRTIKSSKDVKSFLSKQGTSWFFNIPLAAWQGGTWERMVRSVKRCLKKVIGRSTLHFEELLTLIVEVESVINARPITYIFDDLEGVSYPLTPSELICGYMVSRLPNDKEFEVISTYESLTRRARHHRRLLQHFAKRWKQEYLLGIREVLSQSSQSKKPDVSVGDIVIVKNEQSKRQFWKLARVEELIVGKDGNIRSAKLSMPSDGANCKSLLRPLQHLVPLEIPVSKEGTISAADSDNSDTRNIVDVNDTLPVTRSKRNAAIVGELNRRVNKLI